MSKPLGPYSPFVRAGDFIIVSGQGGMRDGAVVEGGVTAQTEQTMRNIAEKRLAEARPSSATTTAMPVVNAIPQVCAAPPGIVNHRDLPFVKGAHLLR